MFTVGREFLPSLAFAEETARSAQDLLSVTRPLARDVLFVGEVCVPRSTFSDSSLARKLGLHWYFLDVVTAVVADASNKAPLTIVPSSVERQTKPVPRDDDLSIYREGLAALCAAEALRADLDFLEGIHPTQRPSAYEPIAFDTGHFMTLPVSRNVTAITFPNTP